MKEQLAKIRAEALSAFESVRDSAALDELRVKYLGKKGELTAVLKHRDFIIGLTATVIIDEIACYP